MGYSAKEIGKAKVSHQKENEKILIREGE